MAPAVPVALQAVQMMRRRTGKTNDSMAVQYRGGTWSRLIPALGDRKCGVTLERATIAVIPDVQNHVCAVMHTP